VYVILSIYVILIAWLGFIDNNNDDDDDNNDEEDDNNDNNDNNVPTTTPSSSSSSSSSSSLSFPDIQLIALIMLLVVPITVSGPIVLMIWEKKVQISSWYTLLSIQIPVLILSIIKISNTSDTNRSAKKKLKRKKKEQQIRSSLIHILFFSFYHQLLSQGKGYVIPYAAIFILWIDIILSLSFMLVSQ
jgi:hypothetical protein